MFQEPSDTGQAQAETTPPEKLLVDLTGREKRMWIFEGIVAEACRM